MRRIFWPAIILLGLIAAGCRSPFGADEGNLEVRFSAGPDYARTIVSDLDTGIESYRIHGATPGAEFERTVDSPAGSVTEEALRVGQWVVTVEARNASGAIVMRGETTVGVSSETTSIATVVLTYLDGSGTLAVSFVWPEVEGFAPTADAELTPDGGTTQGIVFDVDPHGRTAQYTGDWPAGYYTLVVELEDDELYWDLVSAVHIQPSATSATSVLLDSAALGDSGNGPPGELLWSFTAGSALSASIWSSPAIADRRVYFGADTGRLYALRRTTGELLWSYLTDGRITSSPAVGADGAVFVGSHDGNVYAFEPDGTVRWTVATGDWVRSSPAIASDGTVYVGSNDGLLRAIGPQDGEVAWSFSAGSAITSSPAVGPDGTVYFGTYAGEVYAVNPNGTQRWVFTQPTDWVHASPAVGSDGTVYVGSYDGLLYALNGATGALVWSYEAGDWIGSSAAVADGRVYTGTRDGLLHAVNLVDGTRVWTFNAGAGGVYSTPVIGDDGTIYFGSYDRNVYALSPAGSELWRYETSNGIASSPVMDAFGGIYLGSRDGLLYSLGTSAESPADSAWPMFGREARRRAAY